MAHGSRFQPSAISHGHIPPMLLTPYRVLDLSGPLGFLTGRILADLGADVVKVEPPGGDPCRRWPPFHERDGARHSLFWMAFNANKRGITLDLESASGQFVVRQLLPSI